MVPPNSTLIEHQMAGVPISILKGTCGCRSCSAQARSPDLEAGSSAVTAQPEVNAPHPASATVDAGTRSFFCGVSARRGHQLVALGLGGMEVGFSLYNAMFEDAFMFEDSTDFVFASSAIMESVGLAVMFFLALVSLRAKNSKAGEHQSREVGEALEKFGAPLAIVVSGVHQEDRPLTIAGQVGTVCQAVVVGMVGLIFLYKSSKTTFIVLVCIIPTLLFCGWCAAAWSTVPSCLSRDDVRVIEIPLYNGAQTLPDPTDRETLAVDAELVSGVMSVLLVLPLGIDVAEVVLLVLGGESWRAMMLAVLDILVTCFVVLPWSFKVFTSSIRQAAQVVGNVFASFARVSCDLCRECWAHIL